MINIESVKHLVHSAGARLIDWMMALPAKREPALKQAMIAIEQEYKMPFVTSIERLGENNSSLTLTTLNSAAKAFGKNFRLPT